MSVLIVMLMSSVLTQQISWTTKTPLPEARAGAACVVVNDSVYVIGGRGSSSVQYKTTYVYDPVSESWTTRAEMPTARAHIAASLVNGKVYVFGGWVGSTASDAVEEYDPVANAWAAKTPMPTPRYAFCCAVVNERIYVIGGMDMQGNIFNTVEAYDPAGDTVGGTPWQTKTGMPTQRMGPGCAVIHDSIFVFGGSTVIGGGLTTVNQCYDPVSDTWTTKGSLSQARYALGGLMYDDMAFAIGGYDYYNYRTEVEFFDPSMNSWSYETPIQFGRQSVSVGLVGNKIYVIGGWNNGALVYNEEGTLPTGIQEADKGYAGAEKMRLTCSPNPFSSSTTLRLSGIGHGAEGMALGVYDVSGRKVREISLPTADALLHTGIKWDGRDEDGVLLPGGTYIVRFTAGKCELLEPIIIIR